MLVDSKSLFAFSKIPDPVVKYRMRIKVFFSPLLVNQITSSLLSKTTQSTPVTRHRIQLDEATFQIRPAATANLTEKHKHYTEFMVTRAE